MPKKAQAKSKETQLTKEQAELAAAWEEVRNDSDAYCIVIEEGDYYGINIFRISNKGNLAGWRVIRTGKILYDLPADYDMTQFGWPMLAEDGDGSVKHVAKEWEKIKRNAKLYYVEILDEGGERIGVYMHKILKNGKLTGWRVKEKGKPLYDLPANYDMMQFAGFPEADEIPDEDLSIEIRLDPKTFTTPPITEKDLEEFVKNPAFAKGLEYWARGMLRTNKAYGVG